jgi:hypothetical protein
VLIADGGYHADLSHAPQHVGGDIGTARLVAEVFGEYLVPPFRSCEARFDRYLRNGDPLTEYLYCLMDRGPWRK